MSAFTNPFDSTTEPDRFTLWEMLVERDITAFTAANWDAVADDFDVDRFFAVDAAGSLDPDLWGLGFPDLDAYRTSWLKQSTQFRADYDEPAQVLRSATTLARIEIAGNLALAHKRFDGVSVTNSGRLVPLRWRTAYQCAKQDGRWRITGFVGYLPLGPRDNLGEQAVIKAPPSSQHATAGAYSPVLSITPSRTIVISGQAALDRSGAVTCADVAQQTAATLESCASQLTAAGVGLEDVFKVNVYLADISDWGTFDKAYRAHMPGSPLPVRTAVGVNLLPGLRVEIEMWAAAKE